MFHHFSQSAARRGLPQKTGKASLRCIVCRLQTESGRTEPSSAFADGHTNHLLLILRTAPDGQKFFQHRPDAFRPLLCMFPEALFYELPKPPVLPEGAAGHHSFFRRRLSRQHVAEQGPEPVDIGSHIQRLSPQLFGGGKLPGGHPQGRSIGHLRRHGASEVNQHQLSPAEHHVLRLQV